jgi:hypothetical protein
MANRDAIIAVAILTILTIGLIIYSVYLFEAYKNSWFPFISYEPEVPDNAVQLIRAIAERSSEEIERIQAIAADAIVYNFCFYSTSEAIPLTGNQRVLSAGSNIDCRDL